MIHPEKPELETPQPWNSLTPAGGRGAGPGWPARPAAPAPGCWGRGGRRYAEGKEILGEVSAVGLERSPRVELGSLLLRLRH